ncbi:MAG: signal peptide peptidase SppA [Chloroflexi bacterium]|nr:signal peptide peptidase SppA [Chloroflexota bacterium]
MKNKRTLWWILGAVVLVVLACGGLTFVGILAALLSSGPTMGAGGAVAVVEVKGVITSGKGPRSLQSNVAYAENVREDLQAAENDPRVKAIVLEINSPGGGVVPSADIYRALREMTKPVVASMVDVGASGGYYIACGTDRILVRPATITGSIGVIATFVNAAELLEKLGISPQVVKTGRFKDQGSLYRPLTEEELAMLQTLLDEALDDFIQAIVEGRGMPEERVRRLATGRIFSGKQALELGLVDGEGNLDDAIELAAELGHIRGKPQIIRYGPQAPTLLDLLMQAVNGPDPSAERAAAERLLEDLNRPGLQYLYIGP